MLEIDEIVFYEHLRCTYFRASVIPLSVLRIEVLDLLFLSRSLLGVG